MQRPIELAGDMAVAARRLRRDVTSAAWEGRPLSRLGTLHLRAILAAEGHLADFDAGATAQEEAAHEWMLDRIETVLELATAPGGDERAQVARNLAFTWLCAATLGLLQERVESVRAELASRVGEAPASSSAAKPA